LPGHGGCFTSKFIKDALSNLLCQNMGALYTSKDDYVSTETVKEVLENSFVQADSALASEPRMSVKSKVKPPPRNQTTDAGKDVHEFVTIDNSGSTACLCLIGSSDIITANIGDARAVLAQKHGNSFCSVDMSNDHKPHLEDERSRIQKSGCR
jgi:serine/threonine protein phosphatase PrpC